MIVYLDSSALSKLYLNEPGSKETQKVFSGAVRAGTSIISRAEVTAALSKSVHMKVLTETEAKQVHENFTKDWSDLIRFKVTEVLVSRAEGLSGIMLCEDTIRFTSPQHFCGQTRPARKSQW